MASSMLALVRVGVQGWGEGQGCIGVELGVGV